MSFDEGDLERLFRAAAFHAQRFRSSVGDRLQRPELSYRDMRTLFDEPTPETGAPAGAVIDSLVQKAERGLQMATGPRFFGWVIGASHPVGVAADMLTGVWGQNCGNHEAAPAASAAEEVAARWLLDLLDLPRTCSVGFVTGGTAASLVGLAAARSAVLRRAGWDVEKDGLFGAPPIRVVIGDDAHTTVFLALQVLGLGHDRVVRVPTDRDGRMTAAGFRDAMEGCHGPSIAVLQAGQLNTGAFDSFAELIPLARERDAWVHVDGAFGLWARACPSRAPLAAGAEAANSWAVDGHKWLQTPYDTGYAIVRDADAHRRAMTAAASYLPAEEGDDRDPSHLVLELSRRARGFATWAVIRHLGRQGIADMVEGHCRIARRMAEALAREPGIAVENEVCLNQAVVSFGAGEAPDRRDALTASVIRRLQRDGECFVGGARWRGRHVMRLSVISAATTEADADRSVAAIVDAWRAERPGAARF